MDNWDARRETHHSKSTNYRNSQKIHHESKTSDFKYVDRESKRYSKYRLSEHHVPKPSSSSGSMLKKHYSKRHSKAEYGCHSSVEFDWERHKRMLNKIFFRDEDFIQTGTVEYRDFWAFLKKYQVYQRKKGGADKMQNKGVMLEIQNNLFTESKNRKLGRTIEAITTKDIRELLSRAVIDTDDQERFPKEKLVEFQYILLLYLDFCEKQKQQKLVKLREEQNNLPIAQYRDTLVRTVRDNQVVVVAGDTGCGKSTQVPRYLLEAGFEQIACTQPRRLACISLCKRVAYETQNEFGSYIGYQIRFDKSKTRNTKVLFLTEGLLLRQVAVDPMLQQYNIIILDEVHERHLHGDFLLGVVKCLVRQRSDIKIILMSATININLFKDYFWGAPVIQVPGRLYPINVEFRPISEVEKASRTERLNPAPYVRIMQMIDDKYPADERGDLLMFLSGLTEITTVVEAANIYAEQTKRWIILPLHSTLSLAEQDKVFDVAPEGTRKCIVSTNIAETSITIDGIRFVVDSGKVKEMNYDPSCKMQKLQEFWISKASAEQRKGRAGRTGPGVCFRLFEEADYAAMNDYSTPEIQRVPLDSQILQMIALGLPDVRKFPFIEPPSSESIEEAVTSLKEHGAISANEELTPVGRMLSNLPVDITIGKMLIMGSLFDKIGPVLSLAAALSVQSPFTNRSYRDPEAMSARKPLESDHGDPFTLLNAYNEWLVIKSDHQVNSRQWCKRRGLEEQRFYEITKLRRQFEDLLRTSDLLETSSSSGWENMSGVERAQRHGELKRLRGLKREYHHAPKKRKMLKLNDDIHGPASDEEGIDIKDVDFKIQNDRNRIHELSVSSKDFTYRDLLILKIILCSGLYPQLALADVHNSYKPGSDQLFHTKVKPFVVLHPLGVFAYNPDVLQLNDGDIIEHPNLKSRHSISNRHQLIVYVSLLETTKPYLINTMRVSAIHMLLLFSTTMDTNHDFSRIVFDSWLEVNFPNPECGQDITMQALSIRKLWDSVLQNKLQKEECDNDLLMKKVIAFLQEEVYCTIHRLLPADVKNLYVGTEYGSGDVVNVPQELDLSPHPVKGGYRMTDYVTYNCLLNADDEGSCMAWEQSEFLCPFCDQTMMVSVLEKMHHQGICREATEKKERSGVNTRNTTVSSNKKEYFCEECKTTMLLSNTEILKHIRTHKT